MKRANSWEASMKKSEVIFSLFIRSTSFFNKGIEKIKPALNSGYTKDDGFSKKAKWCIIVASLSYNGYPKYNSLKEILRNNFY